jgi:hypothetical protein
VAQSADTSRADADMIRRDPDIRGSNRNLVLVESQSVAINCISLTGNNEGKEIKKGELKIYSCQTLLSRGTFSPILVCGRNVHVSAHGGYRVVISRGTRESEKR